MSLPNLKGTRTRFRNLLERQLKRGKALLTIEIGSIEQLDQVDEIEDCIQSLNVWTEKVDNACAALSIVARNVDKDQEYEQFIEDGNALATEVIECISELERRRKELYLSRGKSA